MHYKQQLADNIYNLQARLKRPTVAGRGFLALVGRRLNEVAPLDANFLFAETLRFVGETRLPLEADRVLCPWLLLTGRKILHRGDGREFVRLLHQDVKMKIATILKFIPPQGAKQDFSVISTWEP